MDHSIQSFGIGERSPWRDFPVIVRNSDLGTLKSEPEFKLAKSGDHDAAFDLVLKVLDDKTVSVLKKRIGQETPLLLPVISVEKSGNNKIPIAMAVILGDRLGLSVEEEIVQSDRILRTENRADYRLAFNPKFTGPVRKGRKYLILDDTLGMGSTIASLRGFVENRGGHVMSAMVMTSKVQSLDITVSKPTLRDIERKHGTGMNKFFQENFGYGINELTEGEAGHVKAAASVESLRDRISAARSKRINELNEGKTQSAQNMNNDR